ncbi:MAG: heparinase II/III family protein [Bacteroidetes bacterium]|nr:heparinase II/III family protein [Bacteroidota bacterium]MBU1117044.1 heparinase II/III family protein [Bacteroidota bacterium]MBU1797639.1 heparinase II/III family protein [Bacteroidota bacterium]
MKKHTEHIGQIILIIFLLLSSTLFGQRGIDNIISDSTLISKLVPLNDEIIKIKNDFENGEMELALINLANYFSNKMCDRYFFNWKTFNYKISEYKKQFPGNVKSHYENAREHMSLFNSEPQWVIPSKGKDGSEISAYQLRHLARQHKAVDIMFVYYYSNESSEYLQYLINQINSLATNYYSGNYDKGGNGIFESYRAGNRISNWLFIYNALLASEKFNWRDQIDFIKTFYFHAEELEKETKKFHFGNHHTKGVMALALTSILFPEFDCSEDNLKNSLNLLTEHIFKEVKPDGFQFERTVHYHIGDIDNYFYVYQLAKLNNIEISNDFKIRLKMMFDALTKIALPIKTLPILQDETDTPWAEYNKMTSVMTIGSLLFEEPLYKYFSDKNITAEYYWFFRKSDIEKFKVMKKLKPQLGSTALEEIGYYVMRNGWEKDSEYLIVSAGLSEQKPDHQHGDMLGLYAYANGNIILPNYQCRYFLEDYSYFKNSFVKNVAIVDSIPQGQNWKGNSGGSGFGKWLSLPEPNVVQWQDEKQYSLFIGSHNGYEKNGIMYTRIVLFIKEGFFIIKDLFENISNVEHNFQQIWQGNYSSENNNRLLRSTFQNGSGLDIYQLDTHNYSIDKSNTRGKGSAIVSAISVNDFSFNTLLYPFSNFGERLIISKEDEVEKIGNWKNYKQKYIDSEIAVNANQIITKDSSLINMRVSSIQVGDLIMSFPNKSDNLLIRESGYLKLISLNNSSQLIEFSSEAKLIINDKNEVHKSYALGAGKIIKIRI